MIVPHYNKSYLWRRNVARNSNFLAKWVFMARKSISLTNDTLSMKLYFLTKEQRFGEEMKMNFFLLKGTHLVTKLTFLAKKLRLATKLPFLVKRPKPNKLEFVHTDIWGPRTVSSLRSGMFLDKLAVVDNSLHAIPVKQFGQT